VVLTAELAASLRTYERDRTNAAFHARSLRQRSLMVPRLEATPLQPYMAAIDHALKEMHCTPAMWSALEVLRLSIGRELLCRGYSEPQQDKATSTSATGNSASETG
jgi:hypothetical protein